MDDAAAGETWDYVVVGSGAGGGTAAARLAEYGHSVLVLEAGGDVADDPDTLDQYEVPAFHAFASENPAIAWNFWVEHFADPARQAADWKRQAGKGVLYPRASAVGGCTAHNALIFIRPDDADWQGIADLTGDPSWRPRAMDAYFRRLERCRHRRWPRFLSWLGIDYSGHGWKGWLTTERALPRQAKFDPQLTALIVSSAQAALLKAPQALAAVVRYLIGRSDPNARRQLAGKALRVWYTPMTTHGHRRVGTRERLAQVAAQGARLEVRRHALATRVLFDDANRAVGVAYLEGKGLYRAGGSGGRGAPRTVRAAREVILAGGAFNTPQLLMLSGVGPADELRAVGIEPRADLPDVGKNLQDRYEVSVVNRLTCDWQALEGARFDRTDRHFAAWRRRQGMYISNGAAVALATASPARKDGLRDLFLMALLAPFRGYYPGYAEEIRERRDCLSWTILKARNANRGEVKLRSGDPLEPPQINFRHFEDGGDCAADLAAMTHAVQLARRMADPLRRRGLIAEEEEPGETVRTQADIEGWVRANAWGHHAAGTCAIGSVLESDFRVRGTQGLRVADASVFPLIPGFFIACAVYMVGEKAADVIHAQAMKEARHAPAAAA